MPYICANSRREKGIITLLGVLMLFFIVVPIVGLAIDGGAMYMIKAKLQTSVDGSALAAARGLSEALDLTSQQGAATNTAVRWYHANYPTGWMGVGTVADPTVSYPAAPPRTIIVHVDGSVVAPTWFMRIMGVNSITIKAMSEASRRFVNIMLVVDRSGSIYESGSCGAVQSAATLFVNSFVNGQDRLGLVTFGTDYRVDFAPNYTFATGSPNMLQMVSTLYCYGYTNSAAAYWAAYQQLVALNDQGALNVILFFTDGIPNTATFGVASDGTDNRLPAKTLTTPHTYTDPYGLGFDNKNPTTCKDSAGKTSGAGWSPGPFTGVISALGGIYKKDTPSFPATPAIDAQKIGAAEGAHGNCAMDSYFASNVAVFTGGSPSRALAGPGFQATFDVAYLPEEDIFRNLTGTGYGGYLLNVVGRYDNTFPAPYRGKIRIDDLATCTGGCTIAVNDQISLVGENALDNAARRARADSVTRNLNVYTYAIGLGNAPGGVNNTLLERVANDPAASTYDATQPIGQYIYSPTTAQLNQAFTQIASSVLRLSK